LKNQLFQHSFFKINIFFNINQISLLTLIDILINLI
jgi:hypothetical protein